MFNNLHSPVVVPARSGEHSTNRLELWLLGPWLATLDGRPLPTLPTRHARALLARLAMAHPQPLSRLRLQQELWPGDPPVQTATRLRTTLYLLRRALPSLIHADKQTLALAASTAVGHDVQRFLAATGPQATRTALQEAVALYRGPFLEDPPDGWALETSRMLHDCYIQALRRLLAMARAAADAKAALYAARCWVQEEPWEEQAHLAVVHALYNLGDRTSAEAHISYARTLLQGQWGQASCHALDALARAVARLPQSQNASEISRPALLQPNSDSAPDFDRLPLIGRREEMAMLNELWRAARTGQGQVMAVEGQPGIGKTRLVNEFVARVSLRRDTLVLQGTANEQTSTRPLGWFDETLLSLDEAGRAQLRQTLAKLDEATVLALCHYLPALRTLLGLKGLSPLPAPEWSSEAQRRQRVMVKLFEALAASGPVCLVLEDSHQADDESIALARALARQPMRLLVLVTRNPFPRQRAAEGMPRLLLGPLAEQKMQALLEKCLGGPIEPSLLARLLQRSSGNPLFAREILRTLQGQKGLQWRPAGGWGLVHPHVPLPDPVTDLLVRRLRPLQPETRAFLACLAVLGRPAEEGLLVQLWPQSHRRAMAQAEATMQWVVAEQAGRLWFVHDWLGERVLANLDEATRRRWHARIATVLGQTDAGEAMGHAAKAGLWDEALAQALQAGEVALASGHMPLLASAVEVAAQASEHLKLSWRDERIWRRHLMEEGLLAQGERGQTWQQKLHDLQQLAARSDRPAWLAAALIRLGRARQQQDRPADAAQALRRAAGLATEGQQPAQEAEARSILALILAESGELEQAGIEAAAALTAASASGDEALHRLAAIASLFAGREKRLGTAETDQLLSLLASPALQARPRLAVQARRSAALILAEDGAYEVAIEQLQQAVRLAQQMGDAYESNLCQSLLGSLLICCGLVQEGEALAEACLPLARQLGPSTRLVQLLLHLSRAAYAGGRLQAAWQLLEEGVIVAGRLAQPERLPPLLAHQARLALVSGRQATALSAAARCAQLLQQTPGAELNVQHLLAQVWLAGGRPEIAGQAARQAVRQALEGRSCTWISIEALWEAARVLEASGRRAEALQAREQAYAMFLDHVLHFGDGARRQTIVGDSPCYRELARFRSNGARRLVSLPLRHAPGGRALYPDEFLPVVWTIHDEADAPLAEIAGRRQRLRRLIAEAEAQGGAVTVRALADVLAVTPRTVLRDLAALRRAGCWLETRGSVLSGQVAGDRELEIRD